MTKPNFSNIGSSLVRWKPNRKQEKSAIQKHGEWWIILTISQGKLLIRSKDGSDMRNISANQILESQL